MDEARGVRPPAAGPPPRRARVGILQLDPERAPALEELPERLDVLVEQGAEILALPEFWNAAFEEGRLSRGALDSEEELEPLLEWSARRPQVLLCPGSLPLRVAEAPGLANRTWLIQGGAIQARYDKLHLFGPLGEPAWVRPGQGPALATVSVGGGPLTVGLAICYDLRFPELFRDLAARGAELVLLPAQWPKVRHKAFHHLLQARAMENGISVVGINRGGASGNTEFGGGSAAYGMGDDHVFLGPLGDGEAAWFEVDLEAVRRERARLDAVADRRYRLTLP